MLLLVCLDALLPVTLIQPDPSDLIVICNPNKSPETKATCIAHKNTAKDLLKAPHDMCKNYRSVLTIY